MTSLLNRLIVESSFAISTAALVFFEQPMIAVGESVGTAQVCVVCSELPEREILINLNEQLGTAQGTVLTRVHTLDTE